MFLNSFPKFWENRETANRSVCHGNESGRAFEINWNSDWDSQQQKVYRPIEDAKTFSKMALNRVTYFIKYSAHFFYTENDAEIFPAHYRWKVAEKWV